MRKKIQSKKAISPVIATVLLIVVAIGLFIAIFFWIKSMQQESILKFQSDIKQSCLNVNFDATYSSGTVQVQNNANIPIWKAEVWKKSGGSLTPAGTIPGPILSAESASVGGISGCTELKIVPILLGTSKGVEKEYKCEDKAKTISC